MSEKKESLGKTRSGDPKRRILDEATRMRRQQRKLESLETDNFQDDPHAAFAHLAAKTKLPTFSDGPEKKRKKTRSNADHFKKRFRKNFQTLLEELPPEAHHKPSYITAAAPPSKFPPRHFCAVCGYFSNYTCVTCGARYCSVKCLGTHRDTSCKQTCKIQGEKRKEEEQTKEREKKKALLKLESESQAAKKKMTTFSRILLAIFASLCILGTAVGVPTSAPAVTPGNKDAAATSGSTNAGDAEVKHGEAAKVPDIAHTLQKEDYGESKLSKQRLRKQSNRLARARPVRAAAEGASDGEDSSDEDAAAFRNNPRRRDLISCVSQRANNTIPAAHIKGHGTKPFEHQDNNIMGPRLVKGYQQRWQCCEYAITPSHNAHAFVDGGMIFNQTDKSLRVPTCGYYHVFSQIYYRIDPDTVSENSRSVYHLLRFERNCSSWPDFTPVTVMGKTSVTRDDTTTYTSDIIRLCAGGKIWVEIPDLPNGVPCCPMGDEQGTFIGAYLVAETTCHWPPNIAMENLTE